MWLMLQQDEPDEYVISTNESHSVREFCEAAFKVVGTEIVWEGEGVEETGKDKSSDKVVIRVDPKYFRPTEVQLLIGDCGKAERVLGWKRQVDFKNLVKEMVEYDLLEYRDDTATSTNAYRSGRKPKRKIDPPTGFLAEGVSSPHRSGSKTTPTSFLAVGSPKTFFTPDEGGQDAKRRRMSQSNPTSPEKAPQPSPPDGPENLNSF